MGIMEIMLSALKYPRAASFSAANDDDCKALLLWLENTKIRQYKPEERGSLKEFTNPNWQQVLCKYLDEAQCPIKYESSSREEIYKWLIGYAVHLEYDDNAADLNAKAKELQAPDLEEALSNKTPLTDLQSPEVKKQLAQLVTLLRVQDTTGPLQDQLQAGLELLENQLLPLATLAQSAAKGVVPSSAALSSLPLGFGTGDEQVDLAATVLRLLHVKKLRQLQTQIDHAIVAMQEYTANPKTDSALGRVGH